LKKLGSPVKKGDILYRIYAEFPADFKFARQLAGQNSGYTLGSDVELIKPLLSY
jgi:thymidine phosphorylase